MTPASQWQVEVLTDPARAVSVAADLVASEPVAHSVLSTVTASLVREPGRYRQPRWYAVRDPQQHVRLVAMWTPPLPLHLPSHVPEAITALAAELARVGVVLPGVNGPGAAATEFAGSYLPRSGLRQVGAERLGVYDLPGRPVVPFAVAGRRRLATTEATGLVTGWVEEFLAETGDVGADAEQVARRNVEAGQVSLWTVDGDRPVAMCWASAPSGGVVRVSGVYTPPAERRHGYASALVAEVSAAQQESGNRCMLYTELDNPTSNAIYRAIGYRFFGEDARLRFA